MATRASEIAVLGIDPGAKGGLALVTSDEALVWPMPMAGNVVDTQAVAQILHIYEPHLIALEKVHSMPGQGVSSTFTFGRGFGRIEGIAEALSVRVELITPQRWKQTVLAGTAKDKAAAVEFCRRRWPRLEMVQPGGRKPHEGIADALCIAEAARRVFG